MKIISYHNLCSYLLQKDGQTGLCIEPVKQKKIQRKIVNIFLSISMNMCYGCSKGSSHREGSFEYPQHIFWLRNMKYNFQLHTLIWGPALWENLTLCLNYYCCLLKTVANSCKQFGPDKTSGLIRIQAV